MRKNTKGDIAYILLGLLAVTGIVAALAVAPGLGAALKLIDPNPRRAAYKADRALRLLVKTGKVAHTKSGYKVTRAGEVELSRRAFERYQFPPLQAWDKQWRVICFDIPERMKYVRHALHNRLIELNFYRLQDSVYVTPHNCKEILSLIQKAFFLQKYVRGMVVTHVDDERVLLAHFRLTK